MRSTSIAELMLQNRAKRDRTRRRMGVVQAPHRYRRVAIGPAVELRGAEEAAGHAEPGIDLLVGVGHATRANHLQRRVAHDAGVQAEVAVLREVLGATASITAPIPIWSVAPSGISSAIRRAI